MREKIITLENVSFINENYTILKNINLTITKNTITAIIGRSGAGKSTLIKLMAGLLIPNTGKVTILGANFQDDRVDNKREIKEIKKKTGFVFQDAALLSNLSIKENLLLPLDFHYPRMSKAEKEERMMELLHKIKMENELNYRPAQLSLGERKLISIARALITSPEILFLDEALSSIDATLAKRMLILIRDFAIREETTVIMVTYNKAMITQNTERILLIENNQIFLDQDLEEILSLPPEKRPEIFNDLISF